MPDTRPYAKVRPGLWYDADHGRNISLNAHHARAILRRYGYDVEATGPANDRLLDAWKHYRRNVTGGTVRPKEGASEWNTSNARSRNPGGGGKPVVGGTPSEMVNKGAGARHTREDFVNSRIAKPVKGKPDPVVHAHNQAQTHAKASTHAAALGASGHKVGGAAIPGVKTAGPNVNKMIPNSYADSVAGMQFDPQIHQALADRAQGKADVAQAQTDIGSWYKQVQDSLAQAAASDAAAGGQTQAQVNGDIQGILQSLGGSRGAGVVGATGVNALASIAKQAQGQTSLDAQLAPIFQAEQASAASRESALGSQSDAKAASTIEGLQGARGQAKAAAMQAIMQANNQARQQNFGNQLAQQNAGLAAQSLGLNVANTRSTIEARNAATNYQYASLAERQAEFKAQLAGQKAATRSKLGGGGWASLPGQSKVAAVQAALGFAIPQHSKGGQTDWQAVQNTALAYLRGAGFHSARKLSYTGAVPDKQARNDIVNSLNLQIKARRGAPAAAAP